MDILGEGGIIVPTIVKVVFALFLHCKVAIFSSVFDNCIGGDSLLLIKCSHTSFRSH